MERFRIKTSELVRAMSDELALYERDRAAGSGAIFEQSLQLVRRYETLSSYLYATRAGLPANDPFRQRLEETVGDIGQRLGLLQKPAVSGSSFTDRYRAAWREHFPLFLVTLVYFCITTVVGWQVAMVDPTAVSVFVGQAQLEAVLDKHRWFDRLQDNFLFGGFQIAVNNIKVSISACVFGALAGLGGLVVLALNGLMLGGLMGFCFRNGFHRELLGFVVGHGPLELSIIVCAGFCGFVIGRVFYMRPWSLFSRRLRLGSADAGVMLTGILPWLVLAAVIEAGLSPWTNVSDEFKLGVGTVAALAFWLWTLAPPKSVPSSASARKGA